MSDLGMDWNELTEDELRDELSIRGLDTSGTKTDLVEKLQTDDAGKLRVLSAVSSKKLLKIYFSNFAPVDVSQGAVTI